VTVWSPAPLQDGAVRHVLSLGKIIRLGPAESESLALSHDHDPSHPGRATGNLKLELETELNDDLFLGEVHSVAQRRRAAFGNS
jgi:hypothetical protein